MPERGRFAKRFAMRCAADGNDRFVQRQAADRRAGRKGAEQSARHGGGQDDKMALVLGPTDQPPERLRQTRADQTVVIGAATTGQSARGVRH